jgi:hypothetical protein
VATKYPDAEFDPLGEQIQPRMVSHDIVCLHTMAGTFDGTDKDFHKNGYHGLESHFGLAGDGRLKQWQDLDFQADSNFDGNHRVISIETADTGETFPQWDHDGPNVPPWTDAQLKVLIKLVGWLCDQFDIPRELIPDTRPGRRGIAYHRLGVPGNFPPPFTGLVDGGELWTELPKGRGKVCPGDARINQIHDVIMPGIFDTDLFPALDHDQHREILRLARTLEERSKKTFPQISGQNGGRLREVVIAGRALVDAQTTGLVNGAILDGIRRPSPDRPDRGSLREPFKDLIRAALAEAGNDG